MNQEQNPVILTEEDYNLLRSYIGRLPDKQNEMSLAYELQRATVVNKADIPPDIVRLNSEVSVMDLDTRRVAAFRIVLPDKADIREHKVSVLAPMGTALLGFRKGDEVNWKVPVGIKKFRILEVAAP